MSVAMQSVSKPRRRVHSDAFKGQVVDLSLAPGASVAAIALEHGINANLLFGWRKTVLKSREASQAHRKGEAIPSFEAIARYCLRNGFALNIEIKPTPGQEAETGRVVAREAQRLWAADPRGAGLPSLLSSFSPEALQGALEGAPVLPRALLLDSLTAGWFDTARRLGCVASVTNHKVMDSAVIAQLHGVGLRALVYTVNETADAQRLASLGIDGIITDAVDRFSPGHSVFD